MLKNIKDSLEISYKQGLESDDIIYIKGQIKDWEEMLSNIKHEQELKDNALKMYDEGQQEIERLNNNWNKLEKYLSDKVTMYGRLGDLSRMAECQIISQKVQELKGSDK